MPHVEYEENDFIIDFQIEKYPISQEEKKELLKSFKLTGVVGYSLKRKEWMFMNYYKFRPAEKNEIDNLPLLPTGWEDYMVII